MARLQKARKFMYELADNFAPGQFYQCEFCGSWDSNLRHELWSMGLEEDGKEELRAKPNFDTLCPTCNLTRDQERPPPMSEEDEIKNIDETIKGAIDDGALANMSQCAKCFKWQYHVGCDDDADLIWYRTPDGLCCAECAGFEI